MQTSTKDISNRANRLVDLKSCIDFLDKTGNLIRVKSEVDSKYELAGIIYASHKSGCGKAMLFEKVKDSAYPVLCGMLLDREITASVFGVSTNEVSSFMGTCLDNWRKDKDRFPSRVLEKASANEVIEKEIRC